MRRRIFAANWKMNHGPQAARAFLQTFLAHYHRQYDRSVIFFPAAATLTTVTEELHDRPDILVGVQNVYWEEKGAFTGELSASMAREAGAHVALVGHSERRHIFGETDEECALKCRAVERAGMTPMLCVGETAAERDAGGTARVVVRQLRLGVARMETPESSDFMIAYEPVWAIGTGRNATPEDAGAIHSLIREELGKIVGERALAVHILYGGSVNPANVPELLAAPNVDGVLVGGASLQASSWSAITRSEIVEESRGPAQPL